MKVKITKTFVDKYGMNILKGRILDVTEEAKAELEAKGVIEIEKKVSKPKK